MAFVQVRYLLVFCLSLAVSVKSFQPPNTVDPQMRAVDGQCRDYLFVMTPTITVIHIISKMYNICLELLEDLGHHYLQRLPSKANFIVQIGAHWCTTIVHKNILISNCYLIKRFIPALSYPTVDFITPPTIAPYTLSFYPDASSAPSLSQLRTSSVRQLPGFVEHSLLMMNRGNITEHAPETHVQKAEHIVSPCCPLCASNFGYLKHSDTSTQMLSAPPLQNIVLISS